MSIRCVFPLWGSGFAAWSLGFGVSGFGVWARTILCNTVPGGLHPDQEHISASDLRVCLGFRKLMVWRCNPEASEESLSDACFRCCDCRVVLYVERTCEGWRESVRERVCV